MIKNAIQRNAINLYILSNYEKGKLASSVWEFFFEKKRLADSLEIMSWIENVLEGKNAKIDEINKFIAINKGSIFPFDCEMCSEVDSIDYSEEQLETVDLMRLIIDRMKSIVSHKLVNKNDIYELFCLLHAFHILPRALISDLSELYIVPNDALQYADEWMSRIPLSILSIVFRKFNPK